MIKMIKEGNDFSDEPIVMYYKGRKIYDGSSDDINTYSVLRDLMKRDNEFYLDAKDFLENELGFESDSIEDCADSLAHTIFYDSTYADSVDSFYVPFGNFEAFFKIDEVKESAKRSNRFRNVPVRESRRDDLEYAVGVLNNRCGIDDNAPQFLSIDSANGKVRLLYEKRETGGASAITGFMSVPALYNTIWGMIELIREVGLR